MLRNKLHDFVAPITATGTRSNVPHVLISNESILTFVLVSFRFKLTFKSVSKSKSSQPLEEQCIKRGAENWQYNQVSSECRL